MAQKPLRPGHLLPEPFCRECARRGIRAKATAPAEAGRGSANVQLGFQCVL